MKKSTQVVRAHTRLEPPSVQTNKIIITLNSEKLLLTTLTGVRFLFVMQFFGRVIYTAEE